MGLNARQALFGRAPLLRAFDGSQWLGARYSTLHGASCSLFAQRY